MKISTLRNPKYYISSLKMLLVIPVAKLMLKRHPNVWLVAERPNQARDNGYCFFKYLRLNHPDLEVYYIIDKKAKDRGKVKEYGNIIDFNSWKHYLFFCISKLHISAHDDMCAPGNVKITIFTKKIFGYKNVFVPHGVSYGISEFCLAKYGKFDLFICSGKLEYDNVLANYGYTEKQVAYTGFPRLDGWHNIEVNKKRIVLMPTWRAYLAQNKNTNIEETGYFKTYQSLINNVRLRQFLEENDIELVFYLHNNMRKYAGSFCTECGNIILVKDDNQYDIQELLKTSALLVTDYSSVHFDFAYMNKPVIYYQFDKNEFSEKQYQKGLFDVERDGFGPVVQREDDPVSEIEKSIISDFTVEKEYHDRMRNFYQLYDDKNCDRVFNAILGLRDDNKNNQ